MRIAGEHFEGAHGAEGAVDEEREVVGFYGAGVAGFDDDGRFAADGGGVVEIASGGGVGGALAPDDDVVEAEGENHFFGDAILLFPSRRAPVGVRAEAFVEVAAVVVDQVVAAVDDLLGDEEGGALGLRAVGFAGVEAVHAFVVGRIDVGNFLLEGGDVDERNEDDDAGELPGVEGGNEFFDGDVGGGVDTGGDFKVAGGFLAGSGSGGADAEGLSTGHRPQRSRGKNRCNDYETDAHVSPLKLWS